MEDILGGRKIFYKKWGFVPFFTVCDVKNKIFLLAFLYIMISFSDFF